MSSLLPLPRILWPALDRIFANHMIYSKFEEKVRAEDCWAWDLYVWRSRSAWKAVHAGFGRRSIECGHLIDPVGSISLGAGLFPSVMLWCRCLCNLSWPKASRCRLGRLCCHVWRILNYLKFTEQLYLPNDPFCIDEVLKCVHNLKW